VRSASPRPQIVHLGALAICVLFLAGVISGCTTTQEKAALRQAQSKHILEAREKKKETR
jgi:hypothetical protein